MRTIYKYPLSLDADFQKLQLPEYSTIVRFAMQGNKPTIWVHLNTENKLYERTFVIAGTGHELPVNAEPIASCVDGPFIWHLLEIK